MSNAPSDRKPMQVFWSRPSSLIVETIEPEPVIHIGIVLDPPEGYVHYGCPECGRIAALPGVIDDGVLPWCTHINHTFATWIPPGRSSTWTQMEPVIVERHR